MNGKNVLFVLLTVVLSSFSVKSQSLDPKAFTVQSYLGVYMEGDEVMSYDVNEIYNVSLSDGYLIHNILTDGLVTDSQVYKLSNINYQEENQMCSFKATSGISGKIYEYEFSTDSDGSTTMTLTQPDGSKSIFMVSFAILKAFKK